MQQYNKSNFLIIGSIGFVLITLLLFTIIQVRTRQDTRGRAQVAATISLNPTIRYQTITGWEATAQAGQFEYRNLFPKYQNALLQQAVNDLGINRLRVEIYSGLENTRDYFSEHMNGQISRQTWKDNWYRPVNDNADPNAINTSRFHFYFVDHQMDTLVLPMKQLLEAKGEKLYININYVDFTRDTSFEHHTNPAEYGEFVLATYKHLQTKYNIIPDAWEMVLEPDNTEWDGNRMGRAMFETVKKLEANGYVPKFILPSVTNMNNTLNWINGIKAGVKSQGSYTDSQVDTFLSTYVEEFSYHRYGTNDSLLPAFVAEANKYTANLAQLEHINADYRELHTDLKQGNNSAWQQYTLAYPEYPGIGDDGGMYYVIKYPDINNPNPDQYQIVMGSRTKFLRQYFKFIRPGAVRIEATSANNNFDPVAFINKDGKYIVVVRGGGGSFTVGNLPAGTYGIKYTTDAEYNKDLPDVTIGLGQTLTTSYPANGVITIWGKTNTGGPIPTNTLVPTATPTINPTATPIIIAPTITPTRTPTPTQPQSTATIVPTTENGTKVNVTLFLHGIGKGGDNVNPSGGNADPVRKSRNVSVEVYDDNNQSITTKQGTVTYNSTNGNFTGTIDLGLLGSGSYMIKVKSEQFLRKSIPGIVNIIAGQTKTLSSISLVTGDADNNNILSIMDFNIIRDCYSDLGPAVNCSDTNKQLAADITDDGKVNQFDYNLLLREISVQNGE